jgi:hypothetical protein
MELPFPELTIGDRRIPLAGKSFRLEAVLAAAAADALRVVVEAEESPRFPARVGETAVLRLDGEERFRGIVARATARCASAEGPVVEIEARAGWHERARALPVEEEYREVTDSEAAARIADQLGLAARIEPTSEVHRRLRRRGDPLEFLIERGRPARRLVAVAGGTLHFSSALPPGPLEEVGPSAPVLAYRAERGPGGRSGTVALAGLAGISPLDRLRLPALGPACEGLLRVRRVVIRLDPRGFSVEVSWVEEGADLCMSALPSPGSDEWAAIGQAAGAGR